MVGEDVGILEEQVGEHIGRGEEIRDFLKVYRKGSQRCLVCGTSIPGIIANRPITSYGRHCQPEGVVESGMWGVFNSSRHDVD